MTDALLSARNVETWYGPVVAIKGVSFDIAKGRIVTVLGANGAGKTTLLKTLAGVIDPFKGAVTFDGVDITKSQPDAVARRGLVLVPEGRQVFPFLTVLDNLRVGTFARASAAGIDDDIEQVFGWFPRLRDRSAQHGGLLSGGEQQMLAIGRALMGRPRLLLLDEPSLGLSPILTKEIFAIIRRINVERGVTVLVVEQNAAIALAHADDAHVMELGRIVATGSASEIAANADVREFYLGGAHTADRAEGRRQRWKRRKTWR